ncbi:MAG: radical SAM protein [Candidatus Altiarchaeota archaeon]|nr:radical SAM protein [Candidatus Altiarchaeota archaeon]
MTKPNIRDTGYYSYRLGSLPKGCKLCVRGEKLVLFITGLCNRDCFYCPLSDEKKNRDVVYANEWNTGFSGGTLTEEETNTILKEARLCDAKGAGVTGGDPLLVLDRTVEVIRKLKKEFGEDFHVHLYTTPENVTEERLEKLFKAGLDEIRFHPLVWDDRCWDRIDLAKKFNWSVGVEIPAILGYEEQTKKLIDFLEGRIGFLNINELELADTKANKLLEMGYKAKNDESYGVSGSEELALSLMEYVREKGYSFRVHYCTCRLKDAVQMKQRILRRAGNVAQKFDKITEDGMLVRGAIYLPELKPGFGYRKKLMELSRDEREKILSDLMEAKNRLIWDRMFRGDELVVDDFKLRLLASRRSVKKLRKRLKKIGLAPALVEEYPTRDSLEVDVEFL